MAINYAVVNDEGHVIDNVAIEEVDEYGNKNSIPKNHIPANLTKRLWVPVWDFDNEEWREGKDPDLLMAEVQGSKFKELSAECQKDIKGYFEATVNAEAYLFSFDVEAQLNFYSTLTFFNANIINEVEWTVHRNGNAERIVLKKNQFIEVCKVAFDMRDTKIKKLRTDKQNEINGADSVAEVAKIKW